MKSITTFWKAILILTVLILSVPLCLYWWKFGGFYISEDFDEWVKFSTYWTPFIIVALSLLLSYISWQTMEIMKLKEKPLIVVSQEPLDSNKPNSPLIFIVKNIGQGAALELKILVKIEHPTIGSDRFILSKGLINDQHQPVRPTDFDYMLHSMNLTHNEKVKMDWQPNIEKMIIVYNDHYGRVFSLKINQNEVIKFTGDIVGVGKNGKLNGEIWFTDGKSNKPYLGEKRIFVLGEVKRYRI